MDERTETFGAKFMGAANYAATTVFAEGELALGVALWWLG